MLRLLRELTIWYRRESRGWGGGVCETFSLRTEEEGLCRGLQAAECQEETSSSNMPSLREGTLRMKTGSAISVLCDDPGELFQSTSKEVEEQEK